MIETILSLTQLLFASYAASVLILFVCKLLWRQKTTFWNDLLKISNVIILVVAIFYGIAFVVETLQTTTQANMDEQTAFRWRVLGPYGYSYWITAVLPFLAAQIFWFAGSRRSYKTSFIVAFCMIAGSVLSQVVVIATSGYRDYLPSSWTYYAPQPAELVLSLFLFPMLVAIVYFIFRRRKTAAGKRGESRKLQA